MAFPLELHPKVHTQKSHHKFEERAEKKLKHLPNLSLTANSVPTKSRRILKQ
jgi:hypothetical protein